jgi:hypothetical protein
MTWEALILPILALAPAAEASPMPIRIVVAFHKHRLLTDVFREQVAREVRDGLQAALGKMARVSSSDDHPLLGAIREKGLSRALGGQVGREPFQTYFVLIGFTGSEYIVESGMHDGLTGLPGAVTRRSKTTDRAFVARVASLLVEGDLAIHGTITGAPDASGQVKVELQGAASGVDLGRWVAKGDVFAAVRVPDGAPGKPLPFTLLQALSDPAHGVVSCRVWSRYRVADLGPWSGVMVVKLGARSGPVRLRLVQDTPTGLKPLETPMSVQVRAVGFDGPAQVATNARDREVDTSRSPKGTFDKLAFVTVLAGAEVRARIPIAVLDDRIHLIPVPKGLGEEEESARQVFRDLRADVLDACMVQSEMFLDINRLSADAKQRAAAIERIKEAVRRLREDHQRLTKKMESSREAFARAKVQPADLKMIADRLRQLQAGEVELAGVVAKLEEIEKEEASPERKEWLRKRQQAEALERQADVEQALAIYRQAPDKYRTEELVKHIAALEEKWKPKSPEHEKARRWVYETWPKLTTNRMKEQLDNARTALEVFKELGDTYGAIKFRSGALQHADRMLQELRALNPGVNAGDDVAADLIKELNAALQERVAEAEEILGKKAKG